jgi:hypothetical protein
MLVGKEPLLDSDAPVGYVTSAGYGYTVGRNLLCAYIAADEPVHRVPVLDMGKVPTRAKHASFEVLLDTEALADMQATDARFQRLECHHLIVGELGRSQLRLSGSSFWGHGTACLPHHPIPRYRLSFLTTQKFEPARECQP